MNYLKGIVKAVFSLLGLKVMKSGSYEKVLKAIYERNVRLLMMLSELHPDNSLGVQPIVKLE